MSEEDGPLCGYLFDGRGGGRILGWPEMEVVLAVAVTWVLRQMRFF